MKKILTLLLAFVLVLSLCACGGSVENGEKLYEEFKGAGVYVYTGEELTGIHEDYATIHLDLSEHDISLRQAVRDINAYRKSIDLPPLDIVSSQN